ncbi:MAG TPA: hypothetical protein VGH28_26235 [Polyangiaceae bacterium]|jgi:hypothetical protein
MRIRALVLSFVVVGLAPRAALAGAQQEAAAKHALSRARIDHRARHDGIALRLLKQAESACEPDNCSPGTLAALLRDIGSLQVIQGDEDRGRSNFSAALSFDSSIDLDPAYASSKVQAVWNDLKSPQSAQPSGDFDHTPPAEQRQGVPLPVFVTYGGSAHPVSVVVRYRGANMSSFKRLELVRLGGGWGNVIPCGAMQLGRVQYYFEGFDSDGLPILSSGDKRHPYSVQVKEHIEGPPPHLPGRRAPTMCGEGAVEGEETETPPASGGGGTTEEPAPSAPVARRPFAHLWIGVEGDVEFTVLPSGNDVCARSASDGSQSDPNWSCTSDTPEGLDFPKNNDENSTLVSGKSGTVSSGIQPGNVRVKVTLDYAATGNFMIGLAVGYVAAAYSGGVGPQFPPIHLEARVTWVFGDDPIGRAGFAPYLQLGGGVGEYSSNLAITIAQNGVAGLRPVQAWHVGGPGFATLAAGLRYGFSQRVAFFLAARGTAAFGASFFPSFGPELALQFGF